MSHLTIQRATFRRPGATVVSADEFSLSVDLLVVTSERYANWREELYFGVPTMLTTDARGDRADDGWAPPNSRYVAISE